MLIITVVDPRQADSVSCYIDSLTFCRDTTAIDKKTGTYTFPDLLAKLKSCATLEKNCFSNLNEVFKIYEVKLPDELLKTAQIKKFVEYHHEAEEKEIYKKQTLSVFRKKYTHVGQFTVFRPDKTESKIENPASYLRIKGLKLAKIIEIEVSINELQRELGDSWNEIMRQDLIDKAKKIIERGESLADFFQTVFQELQAAPLSKKQRV